MLLKRLTYIAALIFIPDCVLLQTVSNSNIPDDYIPCDNGWFHYKEKCFKISGQAERVKWNEAADHCTGLEGYLATIESKEENDFLVTLLLLETKASAWIGLHDQVNESEYHWHSGSKSEYRNWRESEPSGLNRLHEDCVQLLVDLPGNSVGEWNDNDCAHTLGYICEKKISTEKKNPNPMNCTAAEGGGFRYQKSCYHPVAEYLSWDEAEQYCVKKYGGHLITVMDKTVDFYLKFLLQDSGPGFWIGIKFRDQFQQKWSAGWYVSYNGFKKEEIDFIEGTCALRRQRKEWDIVACKKKYPFICEKSHEEPPVLKPPPKDSVCPISTPGWRDFGGEFCYYVQTSKSVTWYEANFECMRRDAHLLSLHSNEENEILRPFIHYSHVASFIGLMRHTSKLDTGSAFKWTDGSQLDYLNWATGEPNSEDEQCAEARASDMKWNDINCNQKRPFICSVKKIINTTIESTSEDSFSVTTSITTPDHYDSHSSSEAPNSTAAVKASGQVLESGQTSHKIVIAVVVCAILVIIAVIIVILKYRLCAKKSLSTQLQNYKDMKEEDC